MAIDKEKYIKKYIEESHENISIVETLIFDIKDGIAVEDNLAALLRALHTLKGSSRMLEFKRIEELSHALESAFIAFREQRIDLSENAIKLVLGALDLLKTGLDTITQTKDDNIDIRDFTKNLSLLVSNEEYTVIEKLNDKKPVKQETEKQKKQRKDKKMESIRISLDKIDNIIKNIAALQSIEISAKNISQDGLLINKIIKEYVKLFRERNKHDFALSSDLRKLERLSERLNVSLKNHAIDAGNSVRNAYDSVISLRTLPLSVIFDNYPRFVYELSLEMGKKVQLNIEGKENEIDKNIIESMSEVFMHMIRNSIDHGIESPQERKAAGKEETGRLSIVCSRESGSMKIIISDDGRGIDTEKIREKIVREGHVAEALASSLSKEELINFIFQSGFSTSGKVSSISGRGVGMDVVKESVESLKGSIFVESAYGKGTTFTIMIPLSIAALMGFPVESGSMKFIIPANFVETILLLNKEDILTVVDRPEIKYNDRIIKLFYLNHILQLKTEKNISSETIFILIIRSYDDIAALAVDNIDSMRPVILKKIPSFMETMPVFSGIVLNDDYEMVSVLHIPTILKIAKQTKIVDIKKRNIEFEKLRKSILVVDDSKPMREIESDILSAEGYLVDTAADGEQALKAIKSKQYDLICTDLNMSVMDGFLLIENIKKNEESSNTPIIVISSVANEEERQRTFNLGASRYIVKNSFNNNNLLEAVNDLIGEGNG